MSYLRIVVEGQSEERVVKDVLAPHLASYRVWAVPTLVNKSPSNTSRATKGGGCKYRPYQRDITLTLKQNADWYVSAMIDLYALPADFPTPEVLPPPGPARADAYEAAFDADVRQIMGDVYPWRFIPYIQRHELEALLFVEPAVTAEMIHPGNAAYAKKLRDVRDSYGSPEDINDGQHTAPSKRLGNGYHKTQHAPKIIGGVGLTSIRASCPRFDRWLRALEALGTPLEQ